MAAVFLISQATLWLRTGVMPRWMAFLTFPVALVLLFIVTEVTVGSCSSSRRGCFLVSVYILVVNLRRRGEAA